MAKRATPNTSPAEQTYRISFTIRDGENEYAASIDEDFPSEPTERQAVEAVWTAYSFVTDEERAKLLKEVWPAYEENKYLELEGDYRIIEDIVWELVPTRLPADVNPLLKAAPKMLERLKMSLADAQSMVDDPRASADEWNWESIRDDIAAVVAEAEGRA